MLGTLNNKFINQNNNNFVYLLSFTEELSLVLTSDWNNQEGMGWWEGVSTCWCCITLPCNTCSLQQEQEWLFPAVPYRLTCSSWDGARGLPDTGRVHLHFMREMCSHHITHHRMNIPLSQFPDAGYGSLLPKLRLLLSLPISRFFCLDFIVVVLFVTSENIAGIVEYFLSLLSCLILAALQSVGRVQTRC